MRPALLGSFGGKGLILLLHEPQLEVAKLLPDLFKFNGHGSPLRRKFPYPAP
jgi:hypothetical protein